MKIYLVGYMGSGKTRTGEALSKILKYTFTDTDSLIQNREGKSISSIFENLGEEKFREVEASVLRELGKRNNLVIATGGGLPCFHDNINWMNANGKTIYLEASAGVLFHRLAISKQGRPLIEKLSDVELMEQISTHLVQRVPFYQHANMKVNALNIDVKQLAERIKKEFGIN